MKVTEEQIEHVRKLLRDLDAKEKGQTAGTMQEEFERQKSINTKREDDELVNDPPHYQSLVDGIDIDCITAMRAAKGDGKVKAWLECNAFKYNWRLQNKGGNIDAEKAIWNLNKFLELGGCEQ